VDTPLTHADSIVITRSPADLYDMVSDVTRMGEWSPVCKACWWDDGQGPSVGAWFTGRNELAGRDPWETRSQVVAAVPGKEFAFVVGGAWTRWGYTFTPAADGTLVTESWEMHPADARRPEADRGGNLMTRCRRPACARREPAMARPGPPGAGGASGLTLACGP
jgi:polyketide cyclase/dehydrase/lipid transport protein